MVRANNVNLHSVLFFHNFSFNSENMTYKSFNTDKEKNPQDQSAGNR